MHEREEGDSVETRLVRRSSWAGSVGERLRRGRWSPWDFSSALAFWKEKVKAGMLWSLVLGTGGWGVSKSRPNRDPSRSGSRTSIYSSQRGLERFWTSFGGREVVLLCKEYR